MQQDIEEKIRRLENWQIWAEICYLDSSSEYREYLYKNQPAFGLSERNLLILEGLRPRPKLPSQMVLLVAIGFVIMFVCVYFYYLFINAHW